MNDNLILSRAESRAITNAFMRSVYNWMAAGLGLTAVIAYLTYPLLPGFLAQYGTTPIFVLMLVELGLVFYLSARVSKMSGGKATGIFLLYSALNGFTLTPILYAFTATSVASAFLTTAAMFGAMSVYGLLTKRDLTGLGSFCMMGLIGIIVAMILNFFIQSGPFGLVINIVGVLVFVGLTAYDTQRLKEMGETVPHDDAAAVRRGTIMGALTLYLNFINLFIMLLQIFGDRR